VPFGLTKPVKVEALLETAVAVPVVTEGADRFAATTEVAVRINPHKIEHAGVTFLRNVLASCIGKWGLLSGPKGA
jgi:hypothetical protein